MFWRLEGVAQTNSVAGLLDRPDVTLAEILDDDYVLQEVKCGNKRLIDFLIKPTNLVRLTELCVTEPELHLDMKTKYKNCQLASEILSANVQCLAEAFWENDACCSVLAKFVSQSSHTQHRPLNPLLASFYGKVFSVLVAKHPLQVLSFMQRCPDFLDNLIANLDSSAIADCILCLYLSSTEDDIKPGLSLKSHLIRNGFLEKLVSQLDASKPSETHENLSFVLCELIRTLRRNQLDRDKVVEVESWIDPLVEQFESQSFLNALLERILPTDPEKSIESITTSGCAVFLALLKTAVRPDRKYVLVRMGKGNDDEFSRVVVSVPGVSWEPDPTRATDRCLASNLFRFKRYLEYDRKNCLLLPMGAVEVPVGRTRLAITELLSHLLVNGLPMAHEEFVKLDLTRVLLDLFCQHPWSNLLHTNVVNCFICVLHVRLDGQAGDNGSASANTTDTEVDEFGEPIQSTKYPSPILHQFLPPALRLITNSYNAYKSEEVNKKLPRISCYFGHIMRLAVSIYDAVRDIPFRGCPSISYKGPNSSDIDAIISKLPVEDKEAWKQFLSGYLLQYIARNEPDQVDASVPRTAGGVLTDRTEDIAAGSSVDQSERAQRAHVNSVSAKMPDVNKDARSSSPGGAQDVSKKLKLPFEKIVPSAIVNAESAIKVVTPANDSTQMTSQQDDWVVKEITFARQDELPGTAISDGKRAIENKRNSPTGPSSSDEEDEKMEVDKDDAMPPEWFSTSAQSKNSGDNWATFDDWPTSSSAQAGKEKKSTEKPSNENWANFDQLCASKNPPLDDMWS